MSYCFPKSQQEKLRSTSFYYIIYSLKFKTTEYCFFLKRGNRITVSLLYKHITKRTGGLLNYQHLHLNAPLACAPPSGDQSSFSQGRKTWPRSPLALSPRNATVVVSALNTLSCLAPPRFSQRLAPGGPERSSHCSHAGCFMVLDELELQGSARNRVPLQPSGMLDTSN